MLDFYVLNKAVKGISLEDNVINVVTFLCFWREVGTIKILFAKIVCYAKLLST